MYGKTTTVIFGKKIFRIGENKGAPPWLVVYRGEERKKGSVGGAIISEGTKLQRTAGWTFWKNGSRMQDLQP